MRIFHLISDLSGGGAERQLCYLVPELARMGHEVHVAYCNDGPSKVELPGVVLHKLEVRSNHDPFLLFKVFRLTRGIKPHVMQTWLLQMDVVGALVAVLNRIPCVFREASSAQAYTRSLKNRLRIWAASRADVIISNSRGGAAYWQDLFPRRRPRIVNNGLPVEEIVQAKAPLPQGVADLDLPIVLYVGRVIPTKTLVTLVEAFAKVVREEPACLVICGEGELQPELESLARELNLEGLVRFTGFLPALSVWTLMKKAAVFVSLSRFEGCPNTVMEAMASGCPVILSDIPAHREIADESCALLVDASKLDQTAQSILESLRQKEQAAARAAVAKDNAEQWSIKKMASSYESIYKGLL